MKPLYRIYVEGGLSHETRSGSQAKRYAEKCRREGWNVAVFLVHVTVLGELQVRYD